MNTQNKLLRKTEVEEIQNTKDNTKRSLKVIEKVFQYKLEQLNRKKENFNDKLLRISHMMNDEYQKLLNENELLTDSHWFVD